MHPMLNIAIRAARTAGSVIVRQAERADTLNIERKSRNDFVTAVDRQAERIIIDTIRKAYPSHSILAEESGASVGDSYEWIIDPLDGTTNYIHGFPHYAVSIAIKSRGVVEHGLVFDPLRQELFVASRGGGAQLNDRKIRVGAKSVLRDALLGTGFPFRDVDDFDVYIESFKELTQRTIGVRRAGAATLDLAYVAAGRLDGFWEFNLKPWDMAAGSLMIRESGGMVASPSGRDDYLDSGNIVAGNPKIFEAILASLKPHLSPSS